MQNFTLENFTFSIFRSILCDIGVVLAAHRAFDIVDKGFELKKWIEYEDLAAITVSFWLKCISIANIILWQRGKNLLFYSQSENRENILPDDGTDHEERGYKTGGKLALSQVEPGILDIL